MDGTHDIEYVRRGVHLRSIASVFALTVAVAVSEALLFVGEVQYTIWAYSVLLVALSLAAFVYERATSVVLPFALIAVFRLVNLTMPVFAERTLLWLPLVYGPFIPAFVYLGWQTSADNPEPSAPFLEPSTAVGNETKGLSRELPWWLGGNRGGKFRWLLRKIRQFLAFPDEGQASERTIQQWVIRGVVVVLLPFVVAALLVSFLISIVYLAEFEYRVVASSPLITSLSVSQVGLLAVVMIGFVGFVEEFLFRGLLQKVLETRFGIVPGLLLTSGIYGLMHSIYAEPAVLLFTGGLGLLFGLVYDVTDSLVLVSIMHGLQNVFVFGIIPLDGPSSADLLGLITDRGLLQAGLSPVVDSVSAIGIWVTFFPV